MLAWPSQARWLFTVISITSKHMTQSYETWWLLQYRRRMATRTDGQTAQTHCFFYATILKNSVCECRTDISQENCTVNSWMKSDCIDTFSHKNCLCYIFCYKNTVYQHLNPSQLTASDASICQRRLNHDAVSRNVPHSNAFGYRWHKSTTKTYHNKCTSVK